MPNTYEDRNRLLRSIGFASYAAYLESSLWEGIRNSILKPGCECRLCGAAAKVVHHLGYGIAVLSGKSLSPLVPLCYSCHGRIEFNHDKTKKTVVQAQASYNRLWKRRRGYLKYIGKPVGRCRTCGNKAKRDSDQCKPCRRLLSLSSAK